MVPHERASVSARAALERIWLLADCDGPALDHSTGYLAAFGAMVGLRGTGQDAKSATPRSGNKERLARPRTVWYKLPSPESEHAV